MSHILSLSAQVKQGATNVEIRAANESYAQKINIITIVRIYGFNCLFTFVSSPKYEIFRHWLSEVDTLEMKNFIHI